MPKSTKSKSNGRLKWSNAPDIKKRVVEIKNSLDLHWVNEKNLHCFRSEKSKSKAYARIWGLSRVWQKALNTEPAYIIEVLSEKFDSLSTEKQDEVLLHELTHIPKNFSGSLLPHIRKRGKRNFEGRVKKLIHSYRKGTNSI